jgi:outer membrane lipopolysaccharide assembly protein LptE/RlpB
MRRSVAMKLRSWGILLLLCLTGCSYSLPSRMETSQGATRSYSVGVFSNKTSRMDLDTYIRTALDQELAGQHGLVVLPAGQGDQELSGSVLSYARDAVSYTADDKLREYRATIIVEVVLRERATNRPLWRKTVMAYQDFPQDPNLALQFNREEAAGVAAAKKVARQVYLHMMDGF